MLKDLLLQMYVFVSVIYRFIITDVLLNSVFIQTCFILCYFIEIKTLMANSVLLFDSICTVLAVWSLSKLLVIL